MKSSTETMITALEKLAEDIQTDDGVVNACLRETAQRLRELSEAGNELSVCANQIGYTCVENPKWIRRAERSVKRWQELNGYGNYAKN